VDPLRPIPIGKKLAIARQLRREATPAERHAWSLLRNRRLLGLKFRRQHVLHGFIVDFFCPALKLVLELDGSPHDEAALKGYDAARSAWLNGAGYQVIRVRNSDLTRERIEELVSQVLPTTLETEFPLS
jgi:very-short-patch-repair endonuclease